VVEFGLARTTKAFFVIGFGLMFVILSLALLLWGLEAAGVEGVDGPESIGELSGLLVVPLGWSAMFLFFRTMAQNHWTMVALFLENTLQAQLHTEETT
jgi:ABC-type Na+ efflux pump permease subunit